MAILSLFILLLQIIILAIGILIGYRRGLGRSTVRFCYLVVIAVVSFFVGRSIAFSVSDTAVAFILDILPNEALIILEQAPEAKSLVAGMLGGLIAPLIFALLFGLLQLISLIFFKKISTKIVSLITKNQEAPSWSKWAGAGVGVICSYIVATALLIPLSSALYIAEEISDETISIFIEATDFDLDQFIENDTTLYGALTPSTTLAAEKSVKLTPSTLVKGLTSYGFLDEMQEASGTDNLMQTIPVIADVAADALYAYQKTIELGGDEITAIANSAARVVDYLDASPTVKQIAVSSLRAIGHILESGKAFMGLELPKSNNPIVQQIVDSTVHTLSCSTGATIKDDMLMMFGASSETLKAKGDHTNDSTDVSNSGLYSLVQHIDMDNPMSVLKDEKLADSFVSTMGHMSNLSSMHEVVDVVRDFAMDELQEDKEIDLTSESYKPFYEETCSLLEDTFASCREQGLETNSEIAKVMEETISDTLKENDFPVPTEYIPMISICAVTEFNSEKYENGIEIEDVLSFFGVAEIPDWAK